MPNWVSGKKNIITYNQTNEPNTASQGEIWYDTDESASPNFKYKTGFGWKSIFKYGWPYGYNIQDDPLSTIERITFPFDSGSSTIQVGNVASSVFGSVGINSKEYGFIICGSYTTNILRFAFPFDSGTANDVGNASTTRYQACGFNSSTHGYICGGKNTGIALIISSIDRIVFPFNSGTASNVGNMAEPVCETAGCNSSIHGFMFYGNDDYSNLNWTVSNIERLTFPFDSGTATINGTSSAYEIRSARSCNSSTHGYAMGCYFSVDSRSMVDRIEFPFDSGSATRVGNLSGSKVYGAGCNSTTHGYYMGGGEGSATSTVLRIAFASDSGNFQSVGNLSISSYGSVGVDSTDFISLFV